MRRAILCVLFIVTLALGPMVGRWAARDAAESPYFSNASVDAGKVTPHEVVVCNFTIAPGVRLTLSELDFKCACGCTKVLVPESGESSAAIKLSYRSSGEFGRFRKKCLVQRDGEVLAELAICGEVVPEVCCVPDTLSFDLTTNAGRCCLMRIERVGLSVGEFRSIVVRPLSSAITVRETTRENNVIQVECSASESFISEIERDVICEIPSEDASRRLLSRITCVAVGPKVVPSIAFITKGAPENEHGHLFEVAGIGSISEVRLSETVPIGAVEVHIDNSRVERPCLKIQIHDNRATSAFKGVVNIFFTDVGGARCERPLSLPLVYL